MKDNRSVLYWKWEDAMLDSDLPGKIEDICARAEMQTIFIGLHWIRLPLHHPRILEALRLCCRELHQRGQKCVIELCPRNEGTAFYREYPSEAAYLTTATEVPLDAVGRGEQLVNTAVSPHYWRLADGRPAVCLSAFLVERADGPRENALLRAGSARRADAAARLEPVDDGHTRLLVNGGAEAAGKTAIVFMGIPQAVPELASEHFPDFFQEMLDTVRDVGVDGVMSDEWGFDVILGVDSADPAAGKKQELFMEHVSYSPGFARRYRRFEDADLADDLLWLFYREEGREAASYRKINAYHQAFRDIMRQNDEDMYARTKQTLGTYAFFGVHPTWWGNNYLQNFEGFKNGFYWWEAKRDIAQTDEIVLIPIRTALAHKWGSDYWYNMWYSMGTRDIRTYYRETWNNVRWGGRTHYLAYECPNENVVLELKPAGLLESIEEMDAVVRTIDDRQSAAPDSRVLVLFGMQNALNWSYQKSFAPPWYPRHEVLSTLLETTDRIFDRYLCDLVPTSEIENGSLRLEEGRARYGTQDYDAVVLLAPDGMAPECYHFLRELTRGGGRWIAAGPARVYADGTPLSAADRALLDEAVRLDEIACAEPVIETLASWGIARNRFENGCVLQDGSLVFTGGGELPTHNPLSVHVVHAGTRIDFEGEDLLFLRRENGGYAPTYPAGTLKLTKE